MCNEFINCLITALLFLCGCLNSKASTESNKSPLTIYNINYKYEIVDLGSNTYVTEGQISFDISTDIELEHVTVGMSKPYKKHIIHGKEEILYLYQFRLGPLEADSVVHFEKKSYDGVHLIVYYKPLNSEFVCDSTTCLYVNDLIDEKDLQMLNAGVEDIDVAQTVDIEIRDGAIAISNTDKTDIDAVALYNLQGMEVHRSNPKQPDTEIPTSMLKHGIYVLRVTTAKTTITKKVKLR